MEFQDRICLGAIVGVHGIRGEVKVKSFTEVDRDIDKYGDVENEDGSRKFSIKVVGHSKDLLRVKVKGCDDRNTAETLIGTGLYVSRSLLPELGEEEFYHTDLIGLEAKTADGTVIGRVNAVYNFGAGDLLELKMNSGALEMLPFTKQYVPTVDIKDGFIIVEMIQFAEDDEQGEHVEG